ncbi:MAG: MOSC domain-containing protein [Verrucomicrobiota bacterium]
MPKSAERIRPSIDYLLKPKSQLTKLLIQMIYVDSIHIAPGSRLPMKAVDSVVAETQKGLVGDRYHGTTSRHVTLQSLDSLHVASEELGSDVQPNETRRNITVVGGTVPRGPGTRVIIGDAVLEVVRVAAPCRLLDDVIGPGAARALHNRAGSVCRILQGATISVGDGVMFIDRDAKPCL